MAVDAAAMSAGPAAGATHAPGVGYNAQKPARPAVKSASGSASTSDASPSPSSATPDATSTSTFPVPDFSSWSIPGSTPLVKGLVVLGALLLGLALYSKVTGQPMALSLQGFTSRAGVGPANPNAIKPGYAQTIPATIAGADTMSNRVAIVNPNKVVAA